jgi:hypothetical protein
MDMFNAIINHFKAGKFGNVVLEEDGEDQLDRSCETSGGIT